MLQDEEGGAIPGTVVVGTAGWYTRNGWKTKGFPLNKNAGYTKYILVSRDPAPRRPDCSPPL